MALVLPSDDSCLLPTDSLTYCLLMQKFADLAICCVMIFCSKNTVILFRLCADSLYFLLQLIFLCFEYSITLPIMSYYIKSYYIANYCIMNYYHKLLNHELFYHELLYHELLYHELSYHDFIIS